MEKQTRIAHINNIKNVSITSILVRAFMLSGLVYIFDQRYQRVVFAITIGILLIWLLFQKKIMITVKPLGILYYLFVGSFFIDAAFAGSTICIVYGTTMLLIWMILDVYEFRGSYQDACHIYKLSVLFYLVVIAISLIHAKPSLVMYMGILGNPNTLGIATGQLFVLGIAKQAEYIRQQKKLGFKEAVYMVVAFVISMLSSCRIAVFGEAVCVGLIILYYLKTCRKRNKKTNMLIVVYAVIVLVVLAYAMGGVDVLFGKLFLFQKVSHLQDMGKNLGNGRFEMWKYVWNNAGLFGNGSLTLNKPVHNVYFGLMNQWGKVNGILFLLFITISLYKTIRFAFKRKERPWALLPALCSMYFFCVSMTENYMMTAPMVAMFLTLPMISDRFAAVA